MKFFFLQVIVTVSLLRHIHGNRCENTFTSM